MERDNEVDVAAESGKFLIVVLVLLCKLETMLYKSDFFSNDPLCQSFCNHQHNPLRMPSTKKIQ